MKGGMSMNWKKLASLALAAALALSLAVPALGIENDHGPVEGPNSTYIPTVEEAQAYVTAKGWMTGTDKGFEPEGEVTRATMYELLWKMEGSPIVEAPTEHLLQMSESLNGILDTWYTNSARWAYREALTTGVEGGRYEGDRVITKAEVLTVLYRYMKDYKKLDVSVEEGWSLEVFADADKIQAWATDAMMWAWLSGVGCQNDSDPTIDPEAAVKRAELAQMLTAMGSIMEEQTRPWTEDAAVAIEVAEQDKIPAHTVPGTLCAPKDTAGKKLPAVVMLHGTGSNREEAGNGYQMAAPVMAEAGIVTLRIDFMGNGESKADYKDYNYTSANLDAKAAADYLAKLDYVDADKIAVMGWSQGGTNALLAAAAYPETFSAVITWSGAIALDDSTGLFGDKTFAQAKAIADREGSYEMTFDWRDSLQVGQRWFKEVKETDVLKETAKIKAPVLAINGDQDTTVAPENAAKIAQAAKNGRDLYIAGADHTYNVFTETETGYPALMKTVNAGIGFLKATYDGGLVGHAVAASKYGNVTTDINADWMAGAGYEVGDILTVKITGQEDLSVPFGTGYSNVDAGNAIAIADTDANALALAINMGNFASTYALGTQGEDKSWTMDETKTVTVSMGEKAGYLEEYEIRNIDALRTNVREDYESDEVFANFRAVTMGDIADGKLYRGSSPVNPELGRNTYVDAFLKANNVKTVIDLADSEEEYAGYEGVAASYAYTTNTVKLDMGVDFAAEDFAAKLKTGLEFMIANEGPYFVHCNEGKDRCGFVTMVLEMLMGGKADEIVDDYMLSYENYYGVEHESDRWNRIATSNVVANLLKLTGAEDQAALDKADLVKAAETYLTETVGLTAEQVASLKDVLSK